MNNQRKAVILAVLVVIAGAAIWLEWAYTRLDDGPAIEAEVEQAPPPESIFEE